jgi:hypothetical protein
MTSQRCIGTPGFPDLFFAGPYGTAAAEIKTGSAEPRPEQTQWLWTLRAGSCIAVLLREHELAEDGPLDQLLARILAPAPIRGSGSG